VVRRSAGIRCCSCWGAVRLDALPVAWLVRCWYSGIQRRQHQLLGRSHTRSICSNCYWKFIKREHLDKTQLSTNCDGGKPSFARFLPSSALRAIGGSGLSPTGCSTFSRFGSMRGLASLTLPAISSATSGGLKNNLTLDQCRIIVSSFCPHCASLSGHANNFCGYPSSLLKHEVRGIKWNEMCWWWTIRKSMSRCFAFGRQDEGCRPLGFTDPVKG